MSQRIRAPPAWRPPGANASSSPISMPPTSRRLSRGGNAEGCNTEAVSSEAGSHSIMLPVMLAAALLAALAVTGSAAAANPIQVENARAGAFGWRGAEVNGAEIQGYTSEISALPGGTNPLSRLHRPARALRDRRLPAGLVSRRWGAARRLAARHERMRQLHRPGGGLARCRVARDRPADRPWGLAERLLHRPVRASRRSRDRVLGFCDLRRARPARTTVGGSRPGSGQHLGGVQRLGRQEPL